MANACPLSSDIYELVSIRTDEAEIVGQTDNSLEYVTDGRASLLQIGSLLAVPDDCNSHVLVPWLSRQSLPSATCLPR